MCVHPKGLGGNNGMFANKVGHKGPTTQNGKKRHCRMGEIVSAHMVYRMGGTKKSVVRTTQELDAHSKYRYFVRGNANLTCTRVKRLCLDATSVHMVYRYVSCVCAE